RTEGPAAARSGWLDEVAASRHRLAEVRAPQEIRPPNREASLLAELAYALAAAGEEDEARDIVAEALALLPVTRDAMDGPDLLVGAASVYVRLDQPDEAVRLLTEVLAGTNGFTPEALAVDPEWDPIRSHPGFIAMTRPSSGRDTSSSPDQ
ncbi:MAG: hypothetical protein OEZ37_10380, partial [Gemmatimonadota bacterium]|nr:hypothetical protein [Gemmatimonadota bacterium]